MRLSVPGPRQPQAHPSISLNGLVSRIYSRIRKSRFRREDRGASVRSKVDDPSGQYQKGEIYVPLDCRNDRLTREAESESES